MYLVSLLILAGVAAYAVGSRERESGPDRVRGERVALRDRRVVVESDRGRLLHYYDLADLTYFALHARGGGRPYVLLFDFGGERLRLREDGPGVEALLADLVEVAPGMVPGGVDFSRFGEALEARREATFVFVDRQAK